MAGAAAILELEPRILYSKEQMSYEEAVLILQYRSRYRRGVILAATGDAVLTWLATKKLPIIPRLYLKCEHVCLISKALTYGRATAYCSFLRSRGSLNSIIDHIPSLDGTQMKMELGDILLKKYQDNPALIERVSKHFFPEVVYDDSSDIPKLRWLFQNVFGDNAAISQVSGDHDSSSKTSHEESTVLKDSNPGPKQVQTNAAAEHMEHPFDCIFGTPAGFEDNHSSVESNKIRTDRSNTTPKRHTHVNKRHRRRLRKPHSTTRETK